MRLLANKILDIPFNEIQFGRTKENKPYLINKTNKFPNFNFNISHSGDYVVLASEPMDLVGVDVMEMKIPNHKDKDEDILDFFSNMKDCFTSFEWSNIKFSNNLHKQVEQFFIHWTLKESYIKAVGIGLGFELQRAEFTLDNSHYATKATIKIDEKEQPQWKFNLEYIGNYVIAVARGPPSEAILSYQKVLNINNTNHNYQSSLFPHENENSPSFRILTFEELIISS
jgi:4'-phosphopantetheinyl transferase